MEISGDKLISGSSYKERPEIFEPIIFFNGDRIDEIFAAKAAVVSELEIYSGEEGRNVFE